MAVTRIHESPRVTRTYGDAQWQRILNLGDELRDRYGSGGFLRFVQGTWYPGEQLPRWALTVAWRDDGQPCWHALTLFADEREPPRVTDADARRFIAAPATRLGLDRRHVTPGHEEAGYFLWRERRLPVNVDPFDSKLDDELERARLRRVIDQRLDHVGYVLLLERGWQAGPRGRSGSAGAGSCATSGCT